MKKLMIAMVVLAATAHGLAMPTRAELSKAQPLVNDLTADDLRALKAKEKKPGDVAAAHLDLADKADTEAGKYLLLQGAFRLYVRSGDYDAAADVLQRMRGEIAGLPPEMIVEIVNSAMRRVTASKAPKVLAIFRDAQRMIKYRKQLTAAELDVKEKPDDKAVQRRLAECHVGLGDWPKALEIFARIGDEAAKHELDPASAKDFDIQKAANYWWEYPAKDNEPFKTHAAALYRKGLEDGSITGLWKALAEKRVKEMEDVMTVSCAAPRGSGAPTTPKGTTEAGKEASSPVLAPPTVHETQRATPSAAAVKPAVAPTTGPWAVPAKFKAKREHTLKLADGVDMTFCAIPAGKFEMTGAGGGSKNHKVTITRPFWITKTFLTAKQCRAFPSDGKVNEGAKKLEQAAKKLEQAFPKEPIVFCIRRRHAEQFASWLTETHKADIPAGYVFRLPTEAELEYVERASYGKKIKRDVVKDRKVHYESLLKKNLISKSDNEAVPKEFERLRVCGYSSQKPNPWGVFSLLTDHGRHTLDSVDVSDGTEDWRGEPQKNLIYSDKETDPIRIGKRKLVRQWATNRWLVDDQNWRGLAYIVLGPDLVTEKTAAKR